MPKPKFRTAWTCSTLPIVSKKLDTIGWQSKLKVYSLSACLQVHCILKHGLTIELISV